MPYSQKRPQSKMLAAKRLRFEEEDIKALLKKEGMKKGN